MILGGGRCIIQYRDHLSSGFTDVMDSTTTRSSHFHKHAEWKHNAKISHHGMWSAKYLNASVSTKKSRVAPARCVSSLAMIGELRSTCLAVYFSFLAPAVDLTRKLRLSLTSANCSSMALNLSSTLLNLSSTLLNLCSTLLNLSSTLLNLSSTLLNRLSIS